MILAIFWSKSGYLVVSGDKDTPLIADLNELEVVFVLLFVVVLFEVVLFLFEFEVLLLSSFVSFSSFSLLLWEDVTWMIRVVDEVLLFESVMV